MGLASALSTALTGLTAAETKIDVIGNNLANSQTVGFKSSEAVFATQFLQTLSLGAAPTIANGGTNPRQVGLGVTVSGITPNFKQGTIEISSSPSDLAIQGDGFFIVEANQSENLYTRNGIFKLNSENQLTTSTGQRLLGYGVDEVFRVEQSALRPLEIPVGSKNVAKPTDNVFFEGTLTPVGDVATTSEVIESAVLGDGAVPRPDASGAGVDIAPKLDLGGSTINASATGSLPPGAYQYRVTYTNTDGNETTPSDPLGLTVAGGGITLGNLPAPPNATYTTMNVYRTAANGSNFFLLDSTTLATSFTDTGATALSTQPLDDNVLNGNYTYMISYYKAGNVESRPSKLIGPQNVVNGRIVLSDIPNPPAPPEGGGFPAYDQIRIYRNTSNDQNSFFLVDTVAPGTTYVDKRTDAAISDLSVSSNKKIDLDGPRINSNTLLTNVMKRDGLNYINLFPVGTLTYQGEKGGRTLGEKQFTITSTTTVQEYVDFIEQASGIQVDSGDAQNPIVLSENNILGETGTLTPGGYVKDGKIRIVSNTGVLNALNIDLTSFRVKNEIGAVSVPNMAFSSVQDAIGTSAVSDIVVYDSLGVPIDMRVTATLESRTDDQTVYRWYADSSQNQPVDGSGIAVGSGLLQFDGNGNFISATSNQVNINRSGVPSVSPLQFDLDFTAVSGLATENASLAATRQDGSAPGVLTSYSVGDDGTVRGVFSNGVTQTLGQLQLARFTNPAGLDQRGQNMFAKGINSGLPIQGAPGENGIGAVVSGALELSNTDMGADLVDLVLASTQYRGNTRVITTSQQLLDELLNLRR